MTLTSRRVEFTHYSNRKSYRFCTHLTIPPDWQCGPVRRRKRIQITAGLGSSTTSNYVHQQAAQNMNTDVSHQYHITKDVNMHAFLTLIHTHAHARTWWPLAVAIAPRQLRRHRAWQHTTIPRHEARSSTAACTRLWWLRSAYLLCVLICFQCF